GRIVPSWGWIVLQIGTVIYELGAPLLFGLPWTRPVVLAWGLSMHFLIGIMFGPLLWFSSLMMSLLIACFAPARLLVRPLELARVAASHRLLQLRHEDQRTQSAQRQGSQGPARRHHGRGGGRYLRSNHRLGHHQALGRGARIEDRRRR